MTTARVSWYSGEKHELLTGEGVSVGYGFGASCWRARRDEGKVAWRG